jgi:hypothetical protein
MPRWIWGVLGLYGAVAGAGQGSYAGQDCAVVGAFAAAAVRTKAAGETMPQQLRDLEQLLPRTDPAYPVYATIIRDIYTKPWAKSLTEDGARSAFEGECRASQK